MNKKLINSLMNSSYKNLSDIFRYSRTRVIQKENLAEHSYYVTLIADILAEDIIKNHNIDINREKILRYALYHDFEEGITGDIITPVKNSSKKFKEELERIGEELLSESIKTDFFGFKHIQNLILNSHKNYEAFKYINIENKIVKFADMLQALLYSSIEYNTGNAFFKQIISNIINDMNKLYGDDKYFEEYLSEINDGNLEFIN